MATSTISFPAEDDLFFQNNVEQLLPGFGSSYTDTETSFPTHATPSTMLDNNAFSMDGNDDCELLFELDNFVNLLNPNNEDCGFADLNPEMEAETSASAPIVVPVKNEFFLAMYDSDTTSTTSSVDSRNSENSQAYYNYNAMHSIKIEPNKSVLGKRDASFSFKKKKKKKKTSRTPVMTVKTEIKMETTPRKPTSKATRPTTTTARTATLNMRKQQKQNTPFVCTVAGCNCQASPSKIKSKNNSYKAVNTYKKATTPRQLVVNTRLPSKNTVTVIESSIVTASTPMPNSVASQSSAFRGVSCCGRDRKWQARIRDRTVNRVRYLGRFVSQLDAAFEYDKHARTCKGNGAMTNFVSLTPENKELLSTTFTNLGYLPLSMFGLLGEGMEARMTGVLEQCVKREGSSAEKFLFEPTFSPTNMVRVAGKGGRQSGAAVMSRSVFTA